MRPSSSRSTAKTRSDDQRNLPPFPATATTQACAACKYQRRKCQPDCILSPYFPASQPRSFLNSHRLFGVSNIIKTLRAIDPARRHDAVNSIIFHSNARAQDPILGCCRFILNLRRQIAHVASQLDAVTRQIAVLKLQQQQQQPHLTLSFSPDEQRDSIDIDPSNLLLDDNDAHANGSVSPAGDNHPNTLVPNGDESPTSEDL